LEEHIAERLFTLLRLVCSRGRIKLN
jgi:hypothetical protein